MTTTLRKTITTMAACAAMSVGVLAGAPMAAARPGPVVATYKLSPGAYRMQAGLNAVWALNADEFHGGKLYRIDRTSHAMTVAANLPFPAGGLAIGFGSIWITDYFGNAVWRLAPNGHVQAEIATGLQPEWVHAAFGSIWVSDHHGASLTRINGTTNAVLATVQVGAPDTFRDGPQDVTDDGTNVYVGSSNLQALQAVDPATNAVTTPPSVDDVFCGDLRAIAGYVWSSDNCSGSAYQLSTDGSVAQVVDVGTRVPQSLTTLSGDVWMGEATTVDPDTGVGSGAVLDERDPVTGASLRTVAIGGDASAIADGFGDLWVFDASQSTIRRVHV